MLLVCLVEVAQQVSNLKNKLFLLLLLQPCNFSIFFIFAKSEGFRPKSQVFSRKFRELKVFLGFGAWKFCTGSKCADDLGLNLL